MPMSENPTAAQVAKILREYLAVHPDLQLSSRAMDDMARELARAVMSLPIFASSRGQEGCIHCKGSGVTTDHLGYSDYPCDCRRAVPYAHPPEGNYGPLPTPAHRPYYDANGNLLAHGGYSHDQMFLYVATDRAQRHCLHQITEPTVPATPEVPAALPRACDLLSLAIGTLMGQREKIGYTDNSPIAKVVAEAVEFLRPWPQQLPKAEVQAEPASDEPPFLQRLRVEQRELSERQDKLEAFLTTPALSMLDINDADLLLKQSIQQHSLLQTLNQRIHIAAEKHLRRKSHALTAMPVPQAQEESQR